MAPENKTIGRFMLDGILPAQRGTPQVEVTFDINADGILDVSAKDKGTGKEQRITITASSGLSKDEIDGMVKDAEAHADEDERRREEVETRNTAENAAYSAEKLVADNEEKVPDEMKEEIAGHIAAVREALKGEDIEAIKASYETLQQAIQKIGELVYAQADGPPEGGPPPEGGETPGEDGEGGDDSEGTVEGEYREV
jgi:molecular chaperone DnaK